MKLNAALAKLLLMAGSIALAATLAVQAQTAAPAAPEAAVADEPTIPGTVIPRKDGGFLSLTVENGCLTLAFYNAEKKQIEPDVPRVAARWDPSYKVGVERRVLNASGDGKTLVSAPIRPPYNFRIFLVLLRESVDEESAESYSVHFRG